MGKQQRCGCGRCSFWIVDSNCCVNCVWGYSSGCCWKNEGIVFEGDPVGHFYLSATITKEVELMIVYIELCSKPKKKKKICIQEYQTFCFV